jgi:hypothetical protein
MSEERFSFRLTSYSAEKVEIVREETKIYQNETIMTLHKEILRREHKLVYPVATGALLACVHGEGSLYFLAVNSASNAFLSLKLAVDIRDGMIAVLGRADDTHDIPPSSQKLVLVVSRNGKSSSSNQLKFTYISSTVPVQTNATRTATSTRPSLGGTQCLTLAGDLLASSIDNSQVRNRGGDTVDTYLWIPQMGSPWNS